MCKMGKRMQRLLKRADLIKGGCIVYKAEVEKKQRMELKAVES